MALLDLAPRSFEEYEAAGGGDGLRIALGAWPEAVIEEVAKSGLRGRGGAGRATVEGSQRKLEEAAREIGTEIGRAFAALGETISDDDAKQDLKRAVSAIGDAVTVTVNEAGKAVRSRGAADEQPQRPDRDTDEGPASTSG